MPAGRPASRRRADQLLRESRPGRARQPSIRRISRVSIPGGINVPGAELVLRVRDLAPSPQTMVVVNCAGRTRSIIGAQSLINAGVPNKVVALRNGTMGWSLAGLMRAAAEPARPGGFGGGLAWAGGRRPASHAATASSASPARCSDACAPMGAHALSVRRARSGRIPGRTCPGRFGAGRAAGAGHRPICRHARRAHRARRRHRGARGDDRILAAADGLARRVRAGRGRRRDRGRRRRSSVPGRGGLAHRLRRAAELVARDDATVVDLSLSRDYREAHIPVHGLRSARALRARSSKFPLRRRWCSHRRTGGRRPRGAARPARSAFRCAISRAAMPPGRPPVIGSPPTAADGGRGGRHWLKPYERAHDATAAMSEYLAWEIDLLTRIERDGSASFSPLRA